MYTAKTMKDVLEAKIASGRQLAVSVMEHVNKAIPTDRIVRAPILDFEADGNGIFVKLPKSGDAEAARERLHRNAFTQIAAHAEIPGEFARRMIEKTDARVAEAPRAHWGAELMAHNLRTIFRHDPAKYLTRSFQGEMRGFLTNKFRRLDSRQIIDSLADASLKVGALPLSGQVTETRVSLTMILPKIYELTPGEFVAHGLNWQNSDFGNGAHTLNFFLLRPICMNGATMEKVLREVHLGGRLDEEDIWSPRTLRLDSERSASMVKDAVMGYLQPKKIEEKMALLKRASDEKIDVKKMGEYLKKSLGAGDAKLAIEAFNSPDVEMLPPGNSLYRMSNAVSWLAGNEKDAEKAMEMRQVAGEILMKAA